MTARLPSGSRPGTARTGRPGDSDQQPFRSDDGVGFCAVAVSLRLRPSFLVHGVSVQFVLVGAEDARAADDASIRADPRRPHSQHLDWELASNDHQTRSLIP